MNKQITKYRMQGKTAAHKNSIIRSLVIELVRAEKIKTTPAKAKILKSQFDRLVTLAKKGDSGKNKVDSFFASNDRAIERFYKVVETKLQDRNSGYTRTFHTLPRKGDNAQQVYIMLVNMEEKEKKSEVQKLLEKRKKTEAEKTVGGKIKKAVKAAKTK
jgi:large subunit ribosomal protein L17